MILKVFQANFVHIILIVCKVFKLTKISTKYYSKFDFYSRDRVLPGINSKILDISTQKETQSIQLGKTVELKITMFPKQGL